jgi:hypothetical protein
MFYVVVKLSERFVIDGHSPVGTVAIAAALGRFQTSKEWSVMKSAVFKSNNDMLYTISIRHVFNGTPRSDKVLGASLTFHLGLDNKGRDVHLVTPILCVERLASHDAF